MQDRTKNYIDRQTDRILSFNAIKGLGSIGILFSHMAYLNDAVNPFWRNLYIYFMSKGGMCSTLFVLFSGFFMSYTWKNKSFKDYIIGKIKRIYPLTFIVFIMSFLVDIIMSGNDIVSEGVETWSTLWIFNVFVNIFLIKAYIPVREVFYSFHGPSWYISVLFGLYVIGYPFVKGIHSADRQKWLRITRNVCVYAYIIELVICVVVEILNINSLWLSYVNPWFRIFGEGFAGILICEHSTNKIEDRTSGSLAEVISLILFVSAFLIRNIHLNIMNAWIQIIPMAFMIMVFRGEQGCISRSFYKKPWQFLGDISFELYMTHAFVYEGLPILAGMINKALKDWLVYHAGTRFVLTFILCIVVAYIAHVVMESVNRKIIKSR